MCKGRNAIVELNCLSRATAVYLFLASSNNPTTACFSPSEFQFALLRAAAISRSTQATQYAASAWLRRGAPATDTYTGLVVAYGYRSRIGYSALSLNARSTHHPLPSSGIEPVASADCRSPFNSIFRATFPLQTICK